MKKIICSVVLLSMLAACGGGSSEKKEEETNNETTVDPQKEAKEDISQNPDYQKGLSLIAKSDCLTCHKVDEKIIGPTYREVANKYAAMPDTIIKHLAGKIITGGNGVWGEVYMTPHAGVSQEDAEAMVKYILLLKNK